jgi:cardiolipin synthase A/B
MPATIASWRQNERKAESMSWFLAYTIIAWLLRLSMVPTVLRRQLAPGAAIAWLGVVFLHPYIGWALYLAVGETRLDPLRTRVHAQIVTLFRGKHEDGSAQGDSKADLHPIYRPMALQAEKISGLPIRRGNAVQFLPSCKQLIDSLVADIDAAKSRAHLLYYIFADDDTGNPVAAALTRAAARGVKCRVLADAVASRPFFYRNGLESRLIAAGVEVAAAQPVARFRRGLPRVDLRNHRKLSVIDGALAYAGSHNLINPDYGGRRGAPWIDVTGRFTGPIVGELESVFCEDWAFETGNLLEVSITGHDTGQTPMQVVPTGPGEPGKTYRRLLLEAIQCARERIILTTPYFVPDEPTLVSLMMAADRGVDVKLIVPEHPDHIFAAAAGRAHFATLMDAGIAIHLYRPGLLHSKTTTVDDAFALFGSANLDVRSFNLNFELSVLMYGKEVTTNLRAIQEEYLSNSSRVENEQWKRRSALRRYADGAICLLSPLL